ncbi:MAG: SIS domain-containing protein [Candidatus Woesebacteria bacterium]|jgi:hypothetical protein
MKSNTYILNDDKFIKRFGLRDFFDNLPGQIPKIAASLGILPDDDVVKVASTWVKMWREDVNFLNNQAKKCADYIVGKTVIINCDKTMLPAATSWRFDLNVISKNLAWVDMASDMTTRELSAWSGYPVEKPFAIFNILSDFDSQQTRDVFEFADKKLSGHQPKAILVNAAGNSLLEQQLYIAIFGRCVAGYLAALNGVGCKL